jgi:hypothetical protein
LLIPVVQWKLCHQYGTGQWRVLLARLNYLYGDKLPMQPRHSSHSG